jgi:hypothetical protein
MTTLSTFPGSPSIPPASFYNIHGLAGWLNQNPSYKKYFVGQSVVSPYLYPMTSSLSSIGYNAATVPLAPFVTTLSSQQSLQYNQQLELFRKVYAYNSNAYVASYTNPLIPPVYYRFETYQEYTQYKSAVSLVNKLYPFNAMANGCTRGPDQCGDIELIWVVPFPL